MGELTHERLAELKREDWPRFSLDHVLRETGLYNVQGRSGPLGRDMTKEAAEDLARVSGATVEVVPISPGNRALLSAAENPDHASIINAYLHHFVPGDCPSCGYGAFGWGIAHGSGSCSCGWPGTLYHYIVDDRELDDLVCSATCNGFAVCDRRRGEHLVHEYRVYGEKTGAHERQELRCPSPITPPDLVASYAREGSLPFTSRYHAPEIVRFTAMLWAHPYDVHKRSRS